MSDKIHTTSLGTGELPARDDGGPAFPAHDGGIDGATGLVVEARTQGMSLRDWFAGQALAGMLANPKWPNVGGKLPASEEDCAAQWSYCFSDALLAARKAKP